MQYAKFSDTEIKVTKTIISEEIKSLTKVKEEKIEIEKQIASLEHDIIRYTSSLTEQINSLKASIPSYEEIIVTAESFGIKEEVKELPIEEIIEEPIEKVGEKGIASEIPVDEPEKNDLIEN